MVQFDVSRAELQMSGVCFPLWQWVKFPGWGQARAGGGVRVLNESINRRRNGTDKVSHNLPTMEQSLL